MRILLQGLIVSLAIGLAASAHAQAEHPLAAETNPLAQRRFDRGTANPPDFYIYNKKVVAFTPRVSTGIVKGYSRVWLSCTSATDPTNGACPTGAASNNQGTYGTTNVVLRFTERRSRISVDLNVTANRNSYWGNIYGNCYTSSDMFMNAASSIVCKTTNPNTGQGMTAVSVGWSVTAYVSSAELKRIPTGGVWTATLLLDAQDWDDRAKRRWTADIRLDVTDNKNIEAYLPNFGAVRKPRIDLNLRTQPLTNAAGSTVSGLANVDLCLYDGYNSNSSSFQLTVKDALPKGSRLPEQFSVVSQPVEGGPSGNASNAFDRIDYTVEMSGPGQGPGDPGSRKLVNGQTFTLTGINNANIRAVRFWNVDTPVVCTPVPLTLRTGPFNLLDKRSGRYQGTLSIVFTPSL